MGRRKTGSPRPTCTALTSWRTQRQEKRGEHWFKGGIGFAIPDGPTGPHRTGHGELARRTEKWTSCACIACFQLFRRLRLPGRQRSRDSRHRSALALTNSEELVLFRQHAITVAYAREHGYEKQKGHRERNASGGRVEGMPKQSTVEMGLYLYGSIKHSEKGREGRSIYATHYSSQVNGDEAT